MPNSTTLITFLLRAPEGTFAVELLGSWDNFSKPYKLSRDRKTGDHSWRGCHFFEGITCDGDTSDLSAMRNGGLMMGGTYWYYYRLNSETEYHDPSEPYTSCCPLLPGQPVNVLDVPVQPRRPSGGSDSSESLDSLVFTLDPKDKYLPPGVRRARTTSAIQQRKALAHTTSRTPPTRADYDTSDSSHSPPTASSAGDGPTLRPQRSLISIFDKIRRTKSVGSSTPRATTSWHRKIFTRGSSRAGLKSESSKRTSLPEDIPAVPQVPAHILARKDSDYSKFTGPPSLSFGDLGISKTPNPVIPLGNDMETLSISPKSADCSYEVAPRQSTNLAKATFPSVLNTSLYGSFGAPSGSNVVEPKWPHVSYTVDPCPTHGDIQILEAENRNFSDGSPRPSASYVTTSQPSDSLDQVPNFSPTFLDDESELGDQEDAAFGLSSAESSCATDETFSPNLLSKSAQSVPISPIQLSQPELLTESDFDDDSASWTHGSDSIEANVIHLRAPSRAPPPPPLPLSSEGPTFSNPFLVNPSLGGFRGYSLPQDEQGSMHTLRKPTSARSLHTDHPLQHQSSSKDLVQSWNDGSEHRMTALEELIDDVGYLGAFIV